jgi:hypothetical protein
MTISEGTGIPAERPATGAAEAPASELSAKAAAVGDTQESAPLTGQIAPPDDARQLVQQIERTREHLGETVRELAARADVKSVARAKAAEVTGRVKSRTVQVSESAAARATSVRTQVSDQTTAAWQKATAAGAAGRDQLRGQVKPVWEATPEPVRRAVTKGANRAREQWVPITVAAAALIVSYLVLRQLRSQSPDE